MGKNNITQNVELVRYIGNTTRTIDILDEFEGISSENNIKYQRLVINSMIYHRDYEYYFNLVVERGCGDDYIGDITFTQFKTGKDKELKNYINKEITDEIVNRYLNTDKFYKFSKPFLLRAQNSSNRTGYGWEWDWSYGYGTYTEGTYYGETTKYFFVGTYISPYYARDYHPDSRQPFK